MKPSVGHDDFVIPGFILYHESDHSVFLEPLEECVHRASKPAGTYCHSINCSFYYYYYSDFMHVDQDHQLAWGVCPFSSQYTPYPPIFLNCFYQNNLSIHEQTNKQTNALKKIMWSNWVSGQWLKFMFQSPSVHRKNHGLCNSVGPTCYLCLGWHIDATAGGMNGCLEISFAWFIICFKLSGLHLSGPTGSLLLL